MIDQDQLVGEIEDELWEIPTVDAHEHLPAEKEHIQGKADFYHLFEHYCQGDLVAAGATQEDLEFLSDRDRPLEERWQKFRPLFRAIRTGAYARSALLAMRDLLGVEELNGDSYVKVGEQLESLRAEGEYDFVLREKCNIAACIDCWQLGAEFPDYFFHLAPGPQLIDLFSKNALDELGAECGISVHSLDDLLDCMDCMMGEWDNNPKVVGIKLGHAYQRTLNFRKVGRAEAENVFNKILTNETHALSNHEALPLQDYLVFQMVGRASEIDLPIVIHTGLQAGNYNRIRNLS
ncbi:MAG: hypothetical protein KGZ25_07655, partial [Planctomycetes bacterium]|nr:hypothetical protein [Planctomycetota bacterium]